MITFLNPSFWFNFLYFFVAIFLAFYLPGVFFIKKINLNKFQETVISFLFGMVLSGQGDELTAHGINFSDRLTARTIIFYGANPASVSATLLKYNIGYIYMLPTTRLLSADSAQFLTQIYKNKSIKILKVDDKSASEFNKKYKNSYQNLNYYILDYE